ncbi:hypothetical protein ACA910_001641 [Epithemia clementina (nom. ined.)]
MLALVSLLSVLTAPSTNVEAFQFIQLPRQQPRVSSPSVLFAAQRDPFITGNWKLNPQTKQEAIDLATGIADSIDPSAPGDVGIFVPFPFIEAVQNVIGDKAIVGAQCVLPELKGAFTGGVSPAMLQSMGVKWALAGHSERREIFKESDEFINAQCRLLVENDMNVILCIGESLEEFEKNLVKDICEVQLKKNLAGISVEDMMNDKVTIAYEPIWAIGTGKVATPAIAQRVHAAIRQILANMFNDEVAQKTRILYGGSVTPESINGLMDQPDVDGALVGGASLDASKFGKIINFQPAAVPV